MGIPNSIIRYFSNFFPRRWEDYIEVKSIIDKDAEVTYTKQDRYVFGILLFGQFLSSCLYSNVIMEWCCHDV